MPFFEKQGLRYYQFELFDDLPFFHAVLTRRGGFSTSPFRSLNFGGTVGDDKDAILKNHQKAFTVFGYDFESRFDVWQVHGTNILSTNAPRDPDSGFQKADGILTDNPGVTLFMRFADCVPILLADPIRGVIGIVHAGWQGTASQISRIAVEKMKENYGSDPCNIRAGIGPSICSSCYQVGSDVMDAFRDGFGSQSEVFFHRKNQKLYLDLWEANRYTLESAGIDKIEIAQLCTSENLEDWYSHRAEDGRTGRFGVLMRLEDNESGRYVGNGKFDRSRIS